MASRIRVPIVGGLNKSVVIESGATAGAQIGVNLKAPDGSIPSLTQLATLLGVGSVSSLASNVIWQRILQIPPNVTSIAALATSGIVVRDSAGNFKTVSNFPVFQGADGASGQDGDQGPPGPAGAAGAAGAPGAQGPAGLPGADGAPGADGDPVPGPTGPQGAAGATGSTGATGATGAQGPAGPLGPAGDEGAPGQDGDPVPGPMGPQGATGATGSAGATGATGAQGQPGGAGPPGDDGYQGMDGDVVPGQNASALIQQRGAAWVNSTAVLFPVQDVPIVIAEDCTLQDITILTEGGNGSCSIDIWKVPIGSYPPSVSNSIISGTSYPAISGGKTYRDTSLAGFATTAFSKGDCVVFHLNSVSVFSNVTVLISLKRVGDLSTSGYTDARAIAALEGSPNVFTQTNEFNGPASAYAVYVLGNAGAGVSFGELVQAGTNSSDYALMVESQAGTSYFSVRGDGKIQGLGPIAAAFVDMTPDTGSFTGTFTGFTTAVTGTVQWWRIGALVFMLLPTVTGTSNAVSMNMTGIPAAITPAVGCTYGMAANVEDNGVIGSGQAIFAASSSTIQFAKGAGGTAFTNAGTKGIAGATLICYPL